MLHHLRSLSVLGRRMTGAGFPQRLHSTKVVSGCDPVQSYYTGLLTEKKAAQFSQGADTLPEAGHTGVQSAGHPMDQYYADMFSRNTLAYEKYYQGSVSKAGSPQ